MPFEIGKKVKIKPSIENLGNVYKVLQIDGQYVELQCILFYGFENLGDGIGIYGIEQTAWTTKFFDYMFTNTE